MNKHIIDWALDNYEAGGIRELSANVILSVLLISLAATRPAALALFIIKPPLDQGGKQG